MGFIFSTNVYYYISILEGGLMNVLKRIDDLRIERNWTIYRLADESGITQSTIANMFSRKTLPSLSTLQQLCNAFGISLAEFFTPAEEFADNSEFLLVANYRKLSSRDKKVVKDLITSLLKTKND